ncbi:MAG: PEP-CTERM sorting domain-containing protein [Pirellulales bacterium]
MTKMQKRVMAQSSVCCLVVSLALGATGFVRGDSFLWTNFSGDRQFNNPQNWFNPDFVRAPGSGDTAWFGTFGAGVVHVPNGKTIQQLVVFDIPVTLDLGGAGNEMHLTKATGMRDSLVVAPSNGDIAALSLQNGTFFSTDALIGIESGSSGSTTVASNATWKPDNVFLAFLQGSEGELIVNSGFADIFGDLEIGDGGSGGLMVTNGGRVHSRFVGPLALGRDVVGDDAGSTGGATISGAGSEWIAGPILQIGNQGHGTLNIEDGGAVRALGSFVGFSPTGVGEVFVVGLGSTWSSMFDLSLGDETLSGVGTVTMSGDGARIYIGEQGELAGSNLPVTETAIVVSGDAPQGDPLSAKLFVFNGSSLGGATNLYAGVDSGDYARVRVHGMGSQITVNESLHLAGDSNGASGATAELIIESGGIVNVGSTLHVHTGGTVALSTGGTVNVGIGEGAAGAVNVLSSGSIRGSGVISGAVNNSAGSVAPGFSPGVLTIVGDYLQASDGTLEIEIGGTVAGADYDQLVVNGAVVLDGRLNVGFLDLGAGLFSPVAGDVFDILDWGSLSGMFATLNLPALSSPLTWDMSQLYSTGIVRVVSSGLPGDFNQDGAVDAADYVVWRKGLGTTYTQDDYNIWQANFGATLGSGRGDTGSIEPMIPAVPEPSSLLLLLLAATFVYVKKRPYFDPLSSRVSYSCL